MALPNRSRSSGPPAPSPLIPLFIVSVIVGMAILPWMSRYMSAVIVAAQQMNFIVLLTPLLIMLGISLISTYQKWMYPVSSSIYHNPRSEWKNGSSGSGNYILGDHQGDGTGIGLFILLVFALVLIPWR